MTARVLVLALVALQLVAALPVVGASQTSRDAWRPDAFAAERLLAAPAGGVGVAFLAQMEQQGALPWGATQMDASAASGSARAPKTLYRDIHPLCDVNGDGIVDMVSNDLDLTRPPSVSGAPSKVVVMDGTNGTPIWAAKNEFAQTLVVSDDISYATPGQANPDAPRTILPAADVDGDGVCDLVTLGFDNDNSVALPPLGSNVQFSTYHTTLRALSGATGKEIWKKTIEGKDTSADDSVPLFGFPPPSASAQHTESFPTGFAIAPTPKGFEVVVKTTDVDYEEAHDPLGVSQFNLLGRVPSPFRTDLSYESVGLTDHVAILDGKDGAVLAVTDLPSTSDAKVTNVTWIAGVHDLDGDGWPEVVLDQFSFENPRSTGVRDPIDQKPAFEYGRGMRVVAIEGDPAKAGALRWTSVIVDPLTPRPDPPLEQGFEQIAWVHADIVPDLDGDGQLDVVASYVAQEEGLQTSVNGVYRTHFLPLSGANGTTMWDARQAGWGLLRPLGGGRLGLGLVDVPTRPPPQGAFPPKSVRLVVLDAKTGAPSWSYEKSFPVDSYLSYNLALAQYADALAPLDLDGDGILDLVTPAQAPLSAGRDQVLLATSSHTYDIKSGATGVTLQTLTAWGPEGRIVACGAGSDAISVVSGHARRIDITRFDARTGNTTWRAPLFNDAAPRAATTGIDMEGLGAGCATQPGDRTLVWANLEAFSAERRHEVVSIQGALGANGEASWLVPALTGSPSTRPLFLASVDVPEPAPGPRIALGVAVGAATGVSLALLTLTLVSRLPSKLLAIGLVLMMLTLVVPTTPAASLPTLDLARAPIPEPVDAPAAPEAAAEAMREASKNTTESTFDSNQTLSFTYPIGDITGDGHEDALLDVYCTDGFACGGFISIPEGALGLLDVQCGAAQHLFGVDGIDGTVVWDVDVTLLAPITDCDRTYVPGVIPLPGGGFGVVVEKLSVSEPTFTRSAVLTSTEVDMLDARTGDVLWRWNATGEIADDIVTGEEARSAFVNPLLMQEAPATPTMPRPTQPALLLEGIGWSARTAQAYPSPPGFNNGPIILDHYNSVEWVAKLDLATGKETWRADTFGVDLNASFTATITDVTPHEFDSDPPTSVSQQTWSPGICCLDLTGDGVPDVLYREFLWSPLRSSDATGPYDLDAHLVLFDGATGAKAWDRVVRADVPKGPDALHPYASTFFAGTTSPSETMSAEPAGDLDGDGVPDLLLHETRREAQFDHVLVAISGRDGHTLWERHSPRDLASIFLGDADGDGASDLLVVDWYDSIGASFFPDDFVAPQDAHLSTLSGRDGRVLWRATTKEAPADVALILDTMRRNGLIDVDHDGVGDVPVDAPELLGDQTVIHHRTMLSGATGRAILRIGCIGTFCLPARAPDVDGDGEADLGILSGDMNDLWLTIQSSADGHAMWSRRIVAIPSAGYARALPELRLQGLASAGHADVLLNMHMLLRVANGQFTNINADGTVETGVFTSDTLEPQLMRLDGATGRASWTLPRLESSDLFALVRGATPGQQAFEKIEAANARSALDIRSVGAPVIIPSALVGAGAYALVVGLGIVFLRFRRMDEGVPDLG